MIDPVVMDQVNDVLSSLINVLYPFAGLLVWLIIPSLLLRMIFQFFSPHIVVSPRPPTVAFKAMCPFCLADTKQALQAYEFLHMARSNFKSLNFCVISALGAEPQSGRLAVQVEPKHIIDPLLWCLVKSQSRSWTRLWRRWGR